MPDSGCWFGHDDDLEVVSLCRDVAALRTGTPVFVGLEAESGVPVKQVTEEIVDCVGQVPLRSLVAELGDRFLQVLEQIVEVLKVLPEQIASQLKEWGYEERISERSGEQTVDLHVPQVMEPVEMQLECVAAQLTEFPVPQFLGERVQNHTPEQNMVFPVPQIVEERVQNRTLEQTTDFLCLSSWGLLSTFVCTHWQCWFCVSSALVVRSAILRFFSHGVLFVKFLCAPVFVCLKGPCAYVCAVSFDVIRCTLCSETVLRPSS